MCHRRARALPLPFLNPEVVFEWFLGQCVYAVPANRTMAASKENRPPGSTRLPPIRVGCIPDQLAVVIGVVVPPSRPAFSKFDLRRVDRIASDLHRVFITRCFRRLHVPSRFHQFANVLLAFLFAQVWIGAPPQSLLVNKVSTVRCHRVLHSQLLTHSRTRQLHTDRTDNPSPSFR